MTTPRKHRPPKISTPKDDCGWVDAAPGQAKPEYDPANGTDWKRMIPRALSPLARKFPNADEAASRMFAIVGQFVALTEGTLTRASIAADLATLQRSIGESLAVLQQIPPDADEWHDTQEQRQHAIRALEALAQAFSEQAAEIKKAAIGRPSTKPREEFLIEPLALMAKELAPQMFPTIESQTRFATECAHLLGIKTPIDLGDTKRKRKKAPPR